MYTNISFSEMRGFCKISNILLPYKDLQFFFFVCLRVLKIVGYLEEKFPKLASWVFTPPPTPFIIKIFEITEKLKKFTSINSYILFIWIHQLLIFSHICLCIHLSLYMHLSFFSPKPYESGQQIKHFTPTYFNICLLEKRTFISHNTIIIYKNY